MLEQELAYAHHQYKWQPDDTYRCQYGSEDGEPRGVASMYDGCISCICGTVDADRTWSGLADGHDVCELVDGHPVVLVDDFVLYEREHGIATTEVEYAYFGEDEE